MIKKQFYYGIISICLIILILISRLNNWQGNDKMIYIGIISLLILTLIFSIRFKTQRKQFLVSGIIWIVLTIILSGVGYKVMNFSNSIFWPTKNMGKSLNTIDITYKSYQWTISEPEKLNINKSIIDKMLIDKLEILNYPLSLLIVKNDTLITERYFKGTGKNTAFNIQSATKSFVSILTGISIDKGLILNDTSKIKLLIPEYFSNNTEVEKNEITIKHLLTMQAGWDADNGLNLKGYDWVSTAITNRLRFKPGSAFLYSDIEPHILVNIIEKQSNQSIINFANENLCSKLNITIADWLKSPNGKCMGGGPLFMTSRDMARFGKLILNNGKVDNQTIVDSVWIAKMESNYVENSLMPENVPSKKYGYLLWLDSYNGNGIFLVAGSGGQLIMIVPKLNMILVTTALTDLPPRKLAENALNIQKLLTYFVINQIDMNK
jgi:CubicO group peptidase (beta-lactamase class C family)